MKTAVVYYSLTGNTEHAAREIAEAIGAELIRLEPEREYANKGMRRFWEGGRSAVLAETPALRSLEFDPQPYEQVILAFPVWAGNVAPPMRSFLKEWGSALRGKRLAAFVCESGAGGEKALRKLEECLQGVSLAAKAILRDPKSKPSAANTEALQAFCAACR